MRIPVLMTICRLSCVVSLTSLAPAAFADALPPTVAAALKRAAIPFDAVGIQVREVDSQRALLSANANQARNPASTMKLVTTYAALDLLGPAFSWQTRAYATGTQVGDVLHGDLIIKGGGDPKLVVESFWLFLRQIRARGIREIAGNLVLDRSLFAQSPHDAASFDGDPARPYNAGADALLLNYKSFTFHLVPNPALGVVSLALDPPLAGLSVIAPKLASGECGDWRNKLRLTIDAFAADFAGEYAAACGERTWHVHPWQMSSDRYIELVFRRLWGDLGGSLRGAVREGMTPADARLVAQWQSPPLADIARDINKFSNNVMARQLLLTLAAQSPAAAVDAEAGAIVVRTLLAARGIEAPELVVENGSGLSRAERIAPATLVRLLLTAYRAPVMPEFMSSMPLVGVDGTMRRRLTEQGVAGRAHIKTGLLNEVRAVAGYVLAASGRRYALAFIINHANAQRGNEAQDALLQWVYENG
jgi:D-alanyl-D-alanine carboxypeptidase/D-alanyl-D-alanine-endopeptidase (penicillin-binding protein 4)